MVKTIELVHAGDPPSAQILALLEAAVDLQKAGELARSLDVLQLARTKAPTYPTIHLLLGLAFMEQGNLEKAEAALRQTLDIAPGELQASQALGFLLLRKNRPGEALPMLELYLALSPTDIPTLKAMSSALRRMDRGTEAIELLRNSWQTSGSMTVGIEYARLLVNLERGEDAIGLLSTLADQFPDDPTPHYERVSLLLYRKEFDAAYKIAAPMTEQYPDDDRAWRKLAQVMLRTGQLPKALDAIEHALAIDSRSAHNWLIKAELAQRLHRHDDALQAAEAGLACGVDDDQSAPNPTVPLRMFEAASLLNLERFEEGVARLSAFRLDYPGNTTAIEMECRSLIRLGRLSEALALLRSTTNGQVLQRLASLHYELLHRLDRPQEAWDFIEPQLKFTEKVEQRLEVLAAIGVALYSQGKVKESRAIHAQLTDFAPTHARILCNFGFILLGDGEHGKAELVLRQALDGAVDQIQEALIRSNLGYLALVTERYAIAQDELTAALSLASSDETAIQRIAYCKDAHINSGYSAYPTRSIAIRSAALANLVALRMAEGNRNEAETLVQQLLNEYPGDPTSHEVSGWMHYELGQQVDARHDWERAQTLSDNDELRKVYAQWLEDLNCA